MHACPARADLSAGDPDHDGACIMSSPPLPAGIIQRHCRLQRAVARTTTSRIAAAYAAVRPSLVREIS